MDRTVYIKIAGKEYPMRFSLGASKALCEKFGSLNAMAGKISGDKAEDFEAIVWIVALLIRQGCAYKNIFEPEVPAPENAPVKDGKYIAISQEDLEVALEVKDLKEILEKVFATMGKGQKETIEAEIKDPKSKKNG